MTTSCEVTDLAYTWLLWSLLSLSSSIAVRFLVLVVDVTIYCRKTILAGDFMVLCLIFHIARH